MHSLLIRHRSIDWTARLSLLVMLLPSVAYAQMSEPTVEELVHALQGSDEAAAVQAAEKLGHRASEASSAVPMLIAALRWELPAEKPGRTKQYSEKVAAAAIASLGQIGQPAVEALTQKLVQTDDDAMRVNVLKAIRLISQPGPETELALREAMTDDEADIRREAMLTLTHVASEPESYLIDVVRQLVDSNVENRIAAIRQMDRVDPSGKQAIPFLRDILTGNVRYSIRGSRDTIPEQMPTIEEQVAICHALGAFGKASEAAHVELSDLLNNGGHQVRLNAALALFRIDPQDKELIDYLTKALITLERRPGQSELADAILRELGKHPNRAMLAVETLYDQASSSQKIYALQIAPTISPKKVPDFVVRGTRNLNTFIRIAAIETLGKYPPTNDKASRLVMKSLDDPRWEVRRAGRWQLLNWGTEAKHLLPQLKKRLPLEGDLPQHNSTAYIIRVIETGEQPE